ncbi:MAG: type II toxin-antitoxin system VapC family toxin [Thermoflexales bacterium]|nr:type II toxin-antitoxin system VapC family toxin [Thermoflexales bacterium]
MRSDPPIYVLDTSAVLTLIEDEAGADVVQDLLEKAKAERVVVLISFMSFMEVYYITRQERDQGEAVHRVDLMGTLPISRVESSSSLGIRAGELKANYRLSVADAWIAALAYEQGAALVHKDPEFEQLEGVTQVLKLPYKVST